MSTFSGMSAAISTGASMTSTLQPVALLILAAASSTWLLALLAVTSAIFAKA